MNTIFIIVFLIFVSPIIAAVAIALFLIAAGLAAFWLAAWGAFCEGFKRGWNRTDAPPHEQPSAKIYRFKPD